MRLESFGTDIGSAVIVPDKPIRVNTPSMWKIVYTAGPKGVAAGGCVRITIPYGFSPPQISYPVSVGFTAVETSNPNVQVDIYLGKDPVTGKITHSVWGNNIFLSVSGGALREGDEVTLTYGSTEYVMSNVGAFSQYFEQEVEFTVAVNPDSGRSAPHGGFLLLKNQPNIRIVSDVGSKLIIVVPSNTVVKKPFDVKIAVRDRYGNVAYGYDGNVSVNLKDTLLTHRFSPADRGSHTFHGCLLNSSGTYLIDAKGSRSIFGKSNPTLCSDSESEEKIYWGDIHVMTSLSAGLGTPDEAYEYARHSSHLDFCAVTDGDHADGYLTDGEWEDLKKVVRKHYTPNSFVTFLAYECHERRFAGDKNVYYLGDDEPLIRWSDLPEPGEPFQLWAALGERRAITAPHHTIFIDKLRPWDYHNPEFQRLVEIYSNWGCSEKPGIRQFWPVYPQNSVQSALNRGLRLGIIASSDCHEGHPGNSDWLRIRRGFHGGLVAVYAKELTREAVFEALWNRHCYATTGERIILDFSLNGFPMGTDLRGDEHLETRRIRVKSFGTGPIKRIDVIRNGVDVCTHYGKSVHEEFSWVDKERFDEVCITPKEEAPFIYYYVRVTQQDEEMVWSSPIWVSP